MLISLLLFAAAASHEAPFEPKRAFADAAACQAHLAGLADAAQSDGSDSVKGPYEIAAGDVRIHMVRAEGAGHRIEEHRCLGEKLGARSWTHKMEEEDAPFTVESAARDAAWLKQGAAEQ